SGGRAFPAGEGFLGLSLVLSHRSAIVGDDPFALAPEQVMNRYVRGILEGLRLVGVAAFYPGRDLVTVDGRPLGLVAFEVDRAGALLFEAIVANGRDPSVLPGLLDGDRIREIVFAGDFIANSPAIERLEGELRGAPAEAGAVEAVTRAIFGRPENFLLGAGPLRTVADAVARGLPP